MSKLARRVATVIAVLVAPLILALGCSLFDIVGPERFAALPFAVTEVPAIEVVVLSHEHDDHVDMRTIQALAARGARFVVPLGIGATPARHCSGRGLFDSDRALWAPWVIAGPEQRVLFRDGGDR
ncbi:MAG TPA: MBL fold metallo-hydrolase [Polyangiales bacterium]|nr:MBL fold metallo-hydrolase [Polyangiales bacterium]